MTAPVSVFRYKIDSAGIWVNGYNDADSDTCAQLTWFAERRSNDQYLSVVEARELAAVLVAAADAIDAAGAVEAAS